MRVGVDDLRATWPQSVRDSVRVSLRRVRHVLVLAMMACSTSLSLSLSRYSCVWGSITCVQAKSRAVCTRGMQLCNADAVYGVALGRAELEQVLGGAASCRHLKLEAAVEFKSADTMLLATSIATGLPSRVSGARSACPREADLSACRQLLLWEA